MSELGDSIIRGVKQGIKAAPYVGKGVQAGLKRAWRIAQNVGIEREKAGDRDGARTADEICARIEKELGL